MSSKKIQTLAAAVLTFLLLLYVGYQAYRTTHKDIVTEVAGYGEISDTLQAQGFAIRDETVITAPYQGVLSYRVADGTRILNGGVIADVFASESDAAAKTRLDRLDREIENLNSLSRPSDYFAANPSLISSQIYTALGNISTEVRGNNFSELSVLREDLKTALNRKRLITNEESSESYSQWVSQLQNERDSLARTAGGAIDTITSPAAGYFISSTDGFENVLDLSKIEDVTAEQVRDLLGRTRGTGLSSSVGKICSDFNWYVLCVFSDADMTKFEDVTEVNLDIPFASTETIPAKVIAQNRDPVTGDTAVVFECSYMDSDIASVRNEMVQVNVRTYSGVLVNQKALRFCDITRENENGETVTYKNIKGVYIKSGRQLRFVQVFTEKTVNGYAICKTTLDEEERESLVTDSTIQLYDNVVIEGVDLYDGKPVQ